MTKSIPVSPPVKDPAATRFHAAIGCMKNERYSDKTAPTTAWSETITLQVQTRGKFASWPSTPIADPQRSCKVLLKADVRRTPIDMGWLDNRAFEDPDGNAFEADWLDPKAGTPG